MELVRLDQVAARFAKLTNQGLSIRVGPGAEAHELQRTEDRLGLTLPGQVATFWGAFDGIHIDDPKFVIRSHEDFKINAGLLCFGLCDGSVPIAFDTRSLNEAGQ